MLWTFLCQRFKYPRSVKVKIQMGKCCFLLLFSPLNFPSGSKWLGVRSAASSFEGQLLLFEREGPYRDYFHLWPTTEPFSGRDRSWLLYYVIKPSVKTVESFKKDPSPVGDVSCAMGFLLLTACKI